MIQDYELESYFSDVLDIDIKINGISKEELEKYIGNIDIMFPDVDNTDHDKKVWDKVVRKTINDYEKYYTQSN